MGHTKFGFLSDEKLLNQTLLKGLFGFFFFFFGHHSSILTCLVWFKKNGHSSLSFHHPSLITQFSSLITHHLKHPILFGTITHLSSLNIFQLFVGPILLHCVVFTFFFFSLQPPIVKFTEPSEKKKILKTKLTKPRKKIKNK